ncbi:MAG TPA: hypothetical protein VD903_12895, partial [Pseudonocardia sp.]|nr:hypothetical protein [Pseudonocardia sp.]
MAESALPAYPRRRLVAVAVEQPDTRSVSHARVHLIVTVGGAGSRLAATRPAVVVGQPGTRRHVLTRTGGRSVVRGEIMRRIVLVVVAVLATLVVVPTSAGASTCAPVNWGSGTKTVFNGTGGSVTDIRSGRHECFDRVVIDTTVVEGGYHVTYVDEVTHVGSGAPVPLRG